MSDARVLNDFEGHLEAWWKKEWSNKLFFRDWKESKKDDKTLRSSFFLDVYQFERAVMSWFLLPAVVPLAGSFACFLLNPEKYAQPSGESLSCNEDEDRNSETQSDSYFEQENEGKIEPQDFVDFASESTETSEHIPHGISDMGRYGRLSSCSEQSNSFVERSTSVSSIEDKKSGHKLHPKTVSKLESRVVKLKNEITVGSILAVASLAVLAVGVIGAVSFFTGGIGGVIILGAIAHFVSAVPAVSTMGMSSLFGLVGLFTGVGESCGVVANRGFLERLDAKGIEMKPTPAATGGY